MIEKKDLYKLQKLAKLSFTDSELESFAVKLGYVVEMIDKLRTVDCDNVVPLRSVCDMDQRMREDKVEVQNLSEDLFKNVSGESAEFAKDIKCFVVPKVVE